MAFRQNVVRSQTGGGQKPKHGNQCPCAVCTDLGSLGESVTSPHGRPGSLAGQSVQSGQVPPGGRHSESQGQPSQASGRTDESGRGSRKGTKSPGASAGPSGAYTVSSECLPPRQEGTGKVSVVSPSDDSHDGQGGGGRGRDGQGGGVRDGQDRRGGERPKSAGKRKPKRSASVNRGKGAKGDVRRDGREGEGINRGGQRPRPLCISEGRHGDKGSVSPDDECDFDEPDEEITSQDQRSETLPKEQLYDQIMAETGEREVAPYLPQPSDKNPPPPAPMDPLGPWAVGKPDWTPLGGLTGTRPIVDRYTITRYSLPEWRQHNIETFQKAAGDTNRANVVAFNSRACISEVLNAATKNQAGVTQSLQQRNADVRRWLPELRRSHEELWNALQALSIEDDRLRRILCVLEDILHLVGESIELRSTRMEPDLIHDEVDREMTKELGLVNEIKQLLQRTRDQIRQQLDSSRAAKHRLEQDIADKETTTRIDCANIHLRVDSPTIMFHEGATRFMDNQSTPESWEVLSRENLNLSENEKSKIRSLQAIIQRVVTDSAQDLLAQKAKTEDTIIRHITVIASIIADLEDQLRLVLRSIVETEQLIQEIKESLRKLDFPLKKAQTRLHAREDRPRNENTRDCPQYALIDEVKSIGDQSTALMAQLAPAEEALQALFNTRFNLEKELQSKKKSLFIDRDRILRLRQDYPLAEAIMAHAVSQCVPCR